MAERKNPIKTQIAYELDEEARKKILTDKRRLAREKRKKQAEIEYIQHSLNIFSDPNKDVPTVLCMDFVLAVAKVLPNIKSPLETDMDVWAYCVLEKKVVDIAYAQWAGILLRGRSLSKDITTGRRKLKDLVAIESLEFNFAEVVDAIENEHHASVRRVLFRYALSSPKWAVEYLKLVKGNKLNVFTDGGLLENKDIETLTDEQLSSLILDIKNKLDTSQ